MLSQRRFGRIFASRDDTRPGRYPLPCGHRLSLPYPDLFLISALPFLLCSAHSRPRDSLLRRSVFWVSLPRRPVSVYLVYLAMAIFLLLAIFVASGLQVTIWNIDAT